MPIAAHVPTAARASAPTGPPSHRRRDRLRGAVVVVVGTVLLGVGIGVGVRHLQVDGWSLVAVAGLAVLVAGLVLIVIGGRRWMRSVRHWRRLWAVPVGVLLLWFVVWPVTMALMVAYVPPIASGGVTPADRGIAFEEVDLVTSDGVELAAWYVPSRNGAAVVLRHGATSTRSSVLAHLEILAGAGYGVLATDARGHGDSGGTAMALGWYGDADLAAAVDHLASRPDVVDGRIGVVGLSMGGEESLGAAADDPRVRVVVAEGVSGRTAEDHDLTLPDTAARWFNVVQDRLTYALIDVLVTAPRPLPLRDAVGAIAPRPVLLITGAEALGGETTAAPRLREAAPGSVVVWEVPGADHTGGLATAPGAWTATVVDFLAAALSG